MKKGQIAIATRYYGKREVDLNNFCKWKKEVTETGFPVYVAVKVEEDSTDALDHFKDDWRVFAVQPWGKFVPALNALVNRAWSDGIKQLLIASHTLPAITSEQISHMVRLMDENTLVVGARLEGHEFSRGLHQAASSLTTPWNTLALWNLKLLRYTGFSNQGEALFDPRQTGDEEFVTISQIQQSFPGLGRAMPRAFLTEVPGVENWDPKIVASWDAERLHIHQEKLAGKATRSFRQLQDFGGILPLVTHI